MSDSTTIASAELGEIADRIRNRIRRVTTDILATGEDLNTVKSRLQHGEFIGWIDREFGMTTRTAQRYIRAAEWAKDKNDIVSHLPPATVHLLAAPSTPAEFTERVVVGLEAGNPVNPRLVHEEVSAARAAARADAARTAIKEWRRERRSWKEDPTEQKKSPDRKQFLRATDSVTYPCSFLEELCIERLDGPEQEAHIIANFERAQRDLKQFLDRLRATYADRGAP